MFSKIFIFLNLVTIQLFASSTVLSLSTFIQDSLNNHPQSQISENKYYSTVYKAKSQTGFTDFFLFLNGQYSKGSKSNFSPEFNDGTESTLYTAVLSKRWASLGLSTELALGKYSSLNNPAIQFDTQNIPFPDIHNHFIQLTLRKPIWKNISGIMDRYPFKLAEQEKRLARLVYNEDLESFIAELTRYYLDWRLSFIKKELYRKQFENSKKQVDLIQEQYNRGSVEKRDLLQAQQNQSIQSIDYMNESMRYEQLTKDILSLQFGTYNHPKLTIEPDMNPLNLSKSLKSDLSDGYVLGILSVQNTIFDLNLKYLKENAKTDINAVSKITYDGIGSTDKNSIDSHLLTTIVLR